MKFENYCSVVGGHLTIHCIALPCVCFLSSARSCAHTWAANTSPSIWMIELCAAQGRPTDGVGPCP